MNLTCTQCHMNLPSEDATATHCRHCGAPLPHGEAAARQQEMMRNFMAQHQQPAYVVAAQPAAIVYGGNSNFGAMITKSVTQSMKSQLPR
jgi:PHP family Zn ribbon phosphoesterase